MEAAVLNQGVALLADAVNQLSKLAHKDYWVLLKIKSTYDQISNIDFSKAKLEAANFTEAKREELEKLFKSKLQLVNPKAQLKVEEAIDLIEEGVDIVEDGITQGKAMIPRVTTYINKVKAIFA